MDITPVNASVNAYRSMTSDDVAVNQPRIGPPTRSSTDFAHSPDEPTRNRTPRAIPLVAAGVAIALGTAVTGLLYYFLPSPTPRPGQPSEPNENNQTEPSKGPYGVTTSSELADDIKNGKVVSLSSDHDVSERFDRVLGDAIKTAWKAYNLIDDPSRWTNETLTYMKQLYGDDITKPDVRARVKASMGLALDGMQQMKNNKDRIFLKLTPDPGEENDAAYIVNGDTGPTGEMVLYKRYLEKNEDSSLMVTLMHEATHFSGVGDPYYVNYANGHFRNRGDIKDAPENADSVAWGALILGMNGQPFTPPQEVR